MNTVHTVHKALSGEGIKDTLGSACKIIKHLDLSEHNTMKGLLPNLGVLNFTGAGAPEIALSLLSRN